MTRYFLILMYLSVLPDLQGQYFVARYHDLQTDFSDNNSYRLFTTDDPFLYLTSKEGLIRFDGKNQWMLPRDGSTFIEPTALHWMNDSLWIGLANGHILKYVNRNMIPWHQVAGISGARVTHLEKNSKNQIWIATYGAGVFMFDGKKIHHFHTENGLTSGDIYDGAVLSDQSFLVSTDDGIFICSIVKGKKLVKPVKLQDTLPPIIVEIWYEPEQNIIIGRSYDQKVYVIDPDRSSAWQIPFPFHVKQGLTCYKGTVFAIDEKGTFPLWTFDTKTGKLHSFSLKGIENDISVIDAVMHKEGTMWILCKNNGLISIQTGVFLYDLPLENIQAVETSDDGIYIGDESGLYEMDEEGRLTRILAGENILSLCLDRKNQILWAGTFGNGLIRLDVLTKKIKRLRKKDGLADDNIFSIHQTDHSFWISTLAGVQELFTDGTTKRSLQTTDGLPTDYIYTVFSDQDHTVWLGTESKGLVSLKGNSINLYADKSTVISVTGDKKGVIWFATLRHGLGKWDGRSVKWFTRKEGLTSEKLTGVFCDSTGNVFITHTSGIDWLDPENNQIVYLGNIPGLNAWKMNTNAFDYKDGYHLTAGIAGHIIRYNPGSFSRVSPVLVENLIQCGQFSLKEGKKINLAYDQHNLSVDFSGVYLADPDHIQFRYKLEPLENEWRYTKNMKLVYTELNPGLYNFRVEVGLHNYYFSNKQKIYSFVIHPPFYSTVWFYFLVSCLAGLVIWGIVSYRNKQKKKWMEFETEKVRIQLETLKSQINPHFLFNSFNTLIGTIEEDKKLAILFAEKMSDFYRNILAYRDKNFITLQEELKLHEDYVFLLKQRYGNNLQFITSVEINSTYYIIPLTLQLLTENAIKHNIVSSVKPLVVQIEQDGNTLIVSNNVQVRKTTEKSTTFGLQSLSKRYKSLLNIDIKIINNNNIFSVIIPLSKNDPDINRGR